MREHGVEEANTGGGEGILLLDDFGPTHAKNGENGRKREKQCRD